MRVILYELEKPIQCIPVVFVGDIILSPQYLSFSTHTVQRVQTMFPWLCSYWWYLRTYNVGSYICTLYYICWDTNPKKTCMCFYNCQTFHSMIKFNVLVLEAHIYKLNGNVQIWFNVWYGVFNCFSEIDSRLLIVASLTQKNLIYVY